MHMQAVLPFFVNGAVAVDPSPYWNYFIVYKQTGDKCELAGFFTVYEAHVTFDRLRTKVSQVLVLPTHQRQGLASYVYKMIYDEYRVKDTKCF